LRYISESDLLLLDSYYVGIDQKEPEKFKRILFNHGFDIDAKIEEEIGTHRNLQNKAYKGKRFVGLERTDRAWLRSGYASVEAHINSSKDKSLKEELHNMSREGFSGDIYEDMVERAAKAGKYQEIIE
jgi:hypothetical protein